MVGRFVEQQHVGFGEQQSAQGDTAFFTTRQMFNLGIPGRQTQCVGGDIEVALQLPGADSVDFILQFGLFSQQCVEVGVGFGEGVADLFKTRQ